MRKVDITNIGGKGVLQELLDAAMLKASANIKDVNTPAQEVREIVIKIKLKPNADRKSADMSLACATKFPGFSAVKSSIYFGNASPGEPVSAYADDPLQDELFREQDTPTTKAQ
jgi:hypothetical protein